MKYIEYIKICNFKAFQDEETIKLNGNNLLAYGNNGSGKSSVYWALYTFLQCSEKTQVDIDRYFAIYDDSDTNTYQSLRNVFVDNTIDPYIEIKLKGDASVLKLSKTTLSDIKCDEIHTANLASDFINYKLLHNFYNSTHKDFLNVWSVFKRDIFPYFQQDSISYSELLNDIEVNLPKYPISRGNKFYRRDSWQYGQYQNKISTFNNSLNVLLGNINNQANRILEEKFNINDIKIHLEYITALTWDYDDTREFNTPAIKLAIKYDKDHIECENHRPQSFLNEAVLTRIALSIRLGALFTRIATSDIKILVLDDMLISLDMSNRMIVTKIILEDERLNDFQKIILTHDKAFFNIIKSYTDQADWTYIDIIKDENTFCSKPKIQPALSDLEKARELLSSNDFDTCANHLRKESEIILKKYLKKELNDKFETLKIKSSQRDYVDSISYLNTLVYH